EDDPRQSRRSARRPRDRPRDPALGHPRRGQPLRDRGRMATEAGRGNPRHGRAPRPGATRRPRLLAAWAHAGRAAAVRRERLTLLSQGAHLSPAEGRPVPPGTGDPPPAAGAPPADPARPGAGPRPGIGGDRRLEPDRPAPGGPLPRAPPHPARPDG